MSIKNITNIQNASQAYNKSAKFSQQVKSPIFTEDLKQAMNDYKHNSYLNETFKTSSLDFNEKTPWFAKFENSISSNFKSLRNIFEKAEIESNKVLIGEADSVDLVTSIKEAESLFETVVSIKNSLINAYSEIIKMPI